MIAIPWRGLASLAELDRRRKREPKRQEAVKQMIFLAAPRADGSSEAFGPPAPRAKALSMYWRQGEQTNLTGVIGVTVNFQRRN